jgi:hypothetical protein
MTPSLQSEPEKIEAAGTAQMRWIGWFPLLALPLIAIFCGSLLPAWGFMWLLAFAIFASLKWLTWWRARNRVAHPAWRSLAYLAAWPGMDAEAFLDKKQRVPPPQATAWLWAALKTSLGATLLWVVARSIPAGAALLRGWIGMLGLVMLLHFGTFDLLALMWQTLGVKRCQSCLHPFDRRRLRNSGARDGIWAFVSFPMISSFARCIAR